MFIPQRENCDRPFAFSGRDLFGVFPEQTVKIILLFLAEKFRQYSGPLVEQNKYDRTIRSEYQVTIHLIRWRHIHIALRHPSSIMHHIPAQYDGHRCGTERSFTSDIVCNTTIGLNRNTNW